MEALLEYALEKGLLALAVSLAFNIVFVKIILIFLKELKTGLIILSKQAVTVGDLSKRKDKG